MLKQVAEHQEPDAQRSPIPPLSHLRGTRTEAPRLALVVDLMARFKSWDAKFYATNWLVLLYPGSKFPVYAPRPELPDPLKLSHEFKAEADYLLRKPTNDFVLHCWKDYDYNI